MVAPHGRRHPQHGRGRLHRLHQHVQRRERPPTELRPLRHPSQTGAQRLPGRVSPSGLTVFGGAGGRGAGRLSGMGHHSNLVVAGHPFLTCQESYLPEVAALFTESERSPVVRHTHPDGTQWAEFSYVTTVVALRERLQVQGFTAGRARTRCCPYVDRRHGRHQGSHDPARRRRLHQRVAAPAGRTPAPGIRRCPRLWTRPCARPLERMTPAALHHPAGREGDHSHPALNSAHSSRSGAAPSGQASVPAS